jgi:hypothetical protein
LPAVAFSDKLFMGSLLFLPYFSPSGISFARRVTFAVVAMVIRLLQAACLMALSAPWTALADPHSLVRLFRAVVIQTLCFPTSQCVSYWAKRGRCIRRALIWNNVVWLGLTCLPMYALAISLILLDDLSDKWYINGLSLLGQVELLRYIASVGGVRNKTTTPEGVGTIVFTIQAGIGIWERFVLYRNPSMLGFVLFGFISECIEVYLRLRVTRSLRFLPGIEACAPHATPVVFGNRLSLQDLETCVAADILAEVTTHFIAVAFQIVWTYSYEPTQEYFLTRYHPSVGVLMVRLCVGVSITLCVDCICLRVEALDGLNVTKANIPRIVLAGTNFVGCIRTVIINCMIFLCIIGPPRW